MVDCLYWMDWRRFFEEKWMKMEKIQRFLGKKTVCGTGTKEWYRYPWCRGQVVPVPLKLVPVPTGNEGLVLVLVKGVPVPQLPAALFCIFLHR